MCKIRYTSHSDVLSWHDLSEGYARLGTNKTGAAYPFEDVIDSPAFTTWYQKNQKSIKRLAWLAPTVGMTLFGMSEVVLYFLVTHSQDTLIPAYKMASEGMIPVNGIGASFSQTHGVILINMLIIGFLTLVVSTFLKFTGRGDIIPLVAFVGGGSILYQVITMFTDIYQAIANLLRL